MRGRRFFDRGKKEMCLFANPFHPSWPQCPFGLIVCRIACDIAPDPVPDSNTVMPGRKPSIKTTMLWSRSKAAQSDPFLRGPQQ